MHKNNLLKKGLVVGIIVLFIGTSIASPAQLKNDNISKNYQLHSIPLTYGKTIYVDDDNTEGPWDGTLEHPYQYIRDGVVNSSWGDTIYVFNGTYYERVVVKESIKLFGENKNSTIIDGGGKCGSVIKITAHGVHVSGFTIQNACSCDDQGGINSFSNHNKYYGNNIINNGGNGICLNTKWEDWYEEESNYNSIYLNTIKNNGIAGITIFGDYSTMNVKFRYNKIYDNIVSKNGGGIGVGWLGCCNNEVYRNQINKNNDYGIFVWGFFNSIWGNNITNHNGYGIDLYQGFGTLIKKNNFINNDINAFFVDSFVNRWVSNYWDDWLGVGPKMIKGVLHTLSPPLGSGEEIPWRNFDLRPARNPYDISVVTNIKNSHQSINTLFLRFLENHPNLFPILRQLLGV